jgi:hypothetical protein
MVLRAGSKAFLKGTNSSLFDNFDQFPCFWIRSGSAFSPNTHPDPRLPKQYGSGSATLKKTLPQSHFQDSLWIGEIQKVFGERLELAECGHGQGGRLNLSIVNSSQFTQKIQQRGHIM